MRLLSLPCFVLLVAGLTIGAGPAFSQTAGAAGSSAPSAPPPTATNAAQKDAAPQAASAAASADTIPPGTQITMQNWQNYQQFMPDGMVSLFQGKYYWKMPADVAMKVGPTVNYPLPKGYLEATEKFASQVKIVELPDGGLTLTGYQGGIPFPNPAEPHKGWKVLANLWYRYLPRLVADTDGYTCGMNSMGGANCITYQFVLRQFAFNTDPWAPP